MAGIAEDEGRSEEVDEPLTSATRRHKEKDAKKRRQIKDTTKKRGWIGKNTNVEAKKENGCTAESQKTARHTIWASIAAYVTKRRTPLNFEFLCSISRYRSG
jgi:hypothetical protein